MPSSSTKAAAAMETTPLCALIIGIDRYQYAAVDGIQNLRGCVGDAEAMYRYLVENQRVRRRSIIKLTNQDATRDRIIGSLRAIRDSSARQDDPIWIFWAGHGCRECVGLNEYVEMLVPYDFNPAGDKQAQSIPDYRFGSLITEVCREKGDNITVILDSCHAASSTRWTDSDDFRVRGFDLPTDRTFTASRSGGAIAHSASRTMSSSLSSGWTTSDISSHVLLAATSSSRPAREQGESGVFTRALLNLLRENPGPNRLTYSDVIRRLPPLGEGQTPHCQGTNAGRYLFQTYGPARDHYPFRRQGHDLVVDAGEFHGVTRDAVFDLYDHTRSPVAHGLEVKALGARTATLHTHDLHRLPEEGLAHKTRSGVSMSGRSAIIDSTRNTRNNWPRILLRKLGGSGSRRADCDRVELKCDDRRELSVARGSQAGVGAIFELSDTVSLNAGLRRLHAGDSAVFDNAEHMRDVLSAASDFFHHLRRSNSEGHPLRNKIKVTSHLLESRGGRPAPCGHDLLTRGVLTPEHAYKDGDTGINQCYGFTIVNNYHQPLYFWIFTFEMNDLSIGELYRPVQANGPGADPCTPPGGTLAIGYGNGGVLPQAFFVPQTDDVAITHMKIFVSTVRDDLSHIARGSCFSNDRRFGIGNFGPKGEVWDTLQYSVIVPKSVRS